MARKKEHTKQEEGFKIAHFEGEPDAQDLYAGKSAGNYRIIRQIGRGGMGSIYLAEHKPLDHHVAVKFLDRRLNSDPIYIELFLREGRAAAKLRHPGLVAVYDVGCYHQDAWYLVMEYVEGRDLHDIVEKDGPLTIERAVDYISQAAEALGYAHKSGFVHRDIKPDNLILNPEGRIKICDMGLAKRIGEHGVITQSGLVMGSPNFLSPERLHDATGLDGRADVYSLGGTLFYLLTGRIPFEGSAPVIMAKHLAGPTPDPRELKPDLPEAITPVLKKMMEKVAADRYQSMEELILALKPFPKS
jgi:eukaryotic-like serine/threonine-protein kinase